MSPAKHVLSGVEGTQSRKGKKTVSELSVLAPWREKIRNLLVHCDGYSSMVNPEERHIEP